MIFPRDQLHRVLCNIRTPLPNGTEECGTGMFVVRGTELFLLTASHVSRPSNAGTYLILSDSQANPTRVPLATVSGGGAWSDHAVADLAFLRIMPSQQNLPLFQNQFFPHDHIHLAQVCVSRDVELTAIGFPLGLGAIGRFSPLTFRTYAASAFVTLNRADTHTPQEFFILENPSVGGYSGGPIFDLGYMITGAMTQTKYKTVCYGFMHGTLSDNTGGKLAAVSPSHYLNGWF